MKRIAWLPLGVLISCTKAASSDPIDASIAAAPVAAAQQPNTLPTTTPAGQARNLVTFGTAPGLQHYTETWVSSLTVPMQDKQLLTLERGSARIDIATPGSGPAVATIRFERVEKIEGPPQSAAMLDETLSNQTFSVTAPKAGIQAAAVLKDKTIANEAQAQRARERVFDAFEPDALTQALRVAPVPGGQVQPELVAAFVRSFTARDAVRGGPKLFAESAAIRVKAFNGEVAILEVSATFRSADASMAMRSTLTGELLVDQLSGQVRKQHLSGPIELTAKGGPTTTGTWVEELKREPTP